MLRLLIVEDEDKTRKGLRDCIQWSDYGIEFAGEAANGIDALELIREKPFDLVITDVSMPRMDGIELVREIKNLNRIVKVLFISGHADIPYLKSALQLDAVDYIIKPINLMELDSALKKLVSVFREDTEKSQALAELPKLREKLSDAFPVLRERFFFGLIHGNFTNEGYILDKLQFLDIPLEEDDHFTVMVIDTDVDSGLSGIRLFEEREIQNLSREMAIAQTVSGIFRTFFVYPSENRLCIIFSSKEALEYEQMIQTAEEIQSELFTITGQMHTIGIGSSVESLTRLEASYRCALQALEQQYFLGAGQIIHIQDIEKTRIGKYFYSERMEENILESIRTGNSKRVSEQVDELFDTIRNSEVGLKYVQNTCLEIVIMANRLLMEQKVALSESRDNFYFWQELFTLTTLDSTEKWLKEVLAGISDTIRSIQQNSSNNTVELMKKTINEKYRENITIQKLAEEFYITPNYVCLLFKKETGETFNDYLTRVRIEKAKELLRDPKVKVYEVAELVGFQNQFYFSRLFKKNVGVTPSEFKERIHP